MKLSTLIQLLTAAEMTEELRSLEDVLSAAHDRLMYDAIHGSTVTNRNSHRLIESLEKIREEFA